MTDAVLQDHGIVPKSKTSRDVLVDQVKGAWGTANSYLGSANKQAQTGFFGKSHSAPSSGIVDAWTDSELREFLMMHNIVAPSSKSEELRVLAKQKVDDLGGYGLHASASASSLAAQATDKISEAYYATTDAPRVAYDYVSGAFDG